MRQDAQGPDGVSGLLHGKRRRGDGCSSSTGLWELLAAQIPSSPGARGNTYDVCFNCSEARPDLGDTH